jgi:2-polyprenyl-3-methyl-5-hydroxy-6-metoxy-1,4-benzoquinol methylase
MDDFAMQATIGFRYVTCDKCGSNESRFLFSGPDRLRGLPGQFSVVQCCVCNWIRQNPRPVDADLQKYYPDDYASYAKAIEDEKWFWNRWDRNYGVKKQRKSVERFVSLGRMLEVGCGTGLFLNEMQQRGWFVTGVEPNQYASSYARKRFDLNVFQGTLKEYDAAPESFDVVCAWNVVEHLPRPAQDLRRMQVALRKGGLLVMSVPNLGSLDLRWFGESWMGWDLPRHLYLFPSDALEKFLERNAMRIIDRRTVDSSYYHFLLGAQSYLRDHTMISRQNIDFLFRVARQFPLRIVTAPAFWLLDRLGLSPILTYYIRKD